MQADVDAVAGAERNRRTIPRPSRVLVVEDEPHISRLIEFMLDRFGYQVKVAADGVSALRQAAEFLPDAIILDWNVPPPSGDQLVQALRALESGATAAIVVLTAGFEDKPEPSAAGVDACRLKPIGRSALLRQLEDLGVPALLAAV